MGCYDNFQLEIKDQKKSRLLFTQKFLPRSILSCFVEFILYFRFEDLKLAFKLISRT